MKKIIISIFLMVLFFSFVTKISSLIENKKYVSGFGSFSINTDFEKQIIPVKYDEFDVYKVKFNKVEEFNSFVTELNSSTLALNYDLEELEKKEFFSGLNKLIYQEKVFSEVTMNQKNVKIYAVYKTDDFRVVSDIIILVPEINSCYMILDYKLL